jgi:hypothetical protein
MIPGSANPLLLATAAPTGPYTISRSLRFNSADLAYLSRTPASAGNRKTWTWAGWVKLCRISSSEGHQENRIFLAKSSSSVATYFMFSDNTSDALTFAHYNGSAHDFRLTTTRVFRDLSAWYHMVLSVDTTQSTASNRIKLYVNGIQETTFKTAVYPSQNTDWLINSTSEHQFSNFNIGNRSADLYLADIHFIDGQALDPTSFGEFSATTGVWMPKAFTGSYGTNGFKLDFADNSAATAAALGKDTSGNGNNWTPTNLSVTAGAGNDSLIDVPVNGSQTDTGVGGEVRGNYAVFNPNYPSLSGISYAEGNLQATFVSGGSRVPLSTVDIPRSGKWYFEITRTLGTSVGSIGLWNNVIHTSGGFTVSFFRTYRSNGNKETESASTAYGSSYTLGDIIGVAVDMDNGAIYFSKNGTWQNSGVPTSGASKTGAAFTDLLTVSSWTPGAYMDANQTVTANFGQRPFAYTAPSGFKALCTSSLSTPTIVKPSTVMDVVLYTGTGSTLTPTSSLGFSPDLVWIKSRSAATDNTLYDAVRGAQARLESNNTDAEVTSDNGLTAFNSAGFTLGTLAQVNTSSATYAAWCWDAGSSTVTNTAGTITSSVRANASAGFSVVTYTGNGTSGATVGHGLGVAPSWIIVKNRASDFWVHYHVSLGKDAFLLFDNSPSTTDASYWGSAAPSSSVFGTKGARSNNRTGANFVAYCFTPVAGYSAFGSYTGNGSADGPFVYTGFRPRWVMVKRTDTTSNWTIIDTAREGYNVDNDPLYPNLLDAEGTTDLADILSNGFKLRSTDASVNASSGTYVYAAFSEAAFQYSRAR